jgi:hypothetical protein
MPPPARFHSTAPASTAAAFALIVVVGLALGGGELAAQAGRRSEEVAISISASTRRAVHRGLDYLAAQQCANGSWTDRVGRKVHYSYDGTVTEHIGVTALAGMAFLANGSQPDRGPYALQIQRALEYILAHTQPSGFISAHNSRMYEHAFCTLFLAEVYGMTQDARVREKLKLAIRRIITAQNGEGGWRYLPGAQDSDMSITVCQVMALRAARNAGIQVPRQKVEAAIEYVRRSFRAQTGGFTYQLEDDIRNGPSRVTFALTACGVAALYGAGEYDAFELERGLEFLANNMPPASSAPSRFDWFYGHYYAAQAAFQKGGSFWSRWYQIVQGELLELQEPAGNWRDLVGKNYATAVATIILQVPYQYLPITER